MKSDARASSALFVSVLLDILAIIQQAIEEEQCDDHEGVYYREEPVDAPVYYPVYGVGELLCSSGVYVAGAEIERGRDMRFVRCWYPLQL